MLIFGGVLGLLWKSCSEEAEWVGTGRLGLNEEKNSEVRKEGDRGGSYLPYLVILMQKENWYSWNGACLSGRKQSDMRDLLNRSCCSYQVCRDFYCQNLA